MPHPPHWYWETATRKINLNLEYNKIGITKQLIDNGK